jgi:predicted nucleic acid-binding protein
VGTGARPAISLTRAIEIHSPIAFAVKALFDTNILIDYLNGVPAAEALIDKTRHRMVSVVTWMEVLAGARTRDEEDVIEMFLRDFKLVEISRPVARGAVALRKGRRLRLPDAIILATAQHESAVLITRNTRDFPAGDPGVHVPY